ncbi:adenine phosphoribosyltransferase [Marilutibacter chinensis]|uniref:Adenine phosphoribosyltransferase n=1 Tax=Marilutibacter chinensis TaxID=2912247 RepID=A0ABS9HUK6_9GAMM|nr:adenine phosphoribosyltransferase [Lysobacter chinensis]MCF7221914.1 adenine phosphoribosyltransferase [Lysobacter chinensis]
MPSADDAGHGVTSRDRTSVGELDVDSLRGWIRDVPDFPSVGVLFRDVTPLLADADAFGRCIDALAAPWQGVGVELVCGIESRGFIFGAALAHRLEVGFMPLRKPGKLPPPLAEVEYALEYGRDRLQARAGTLAQGQRVLIVDDVLATGGTLAAAHELVARLGGATVGAGVVIELAALGGRARWPRGVPLHALLDY